jgi:hypothetical protein
MIFSISKADSPYPLMNEYGAASFVLFITELFKENDPPKSKKKKKNIYIY